MTRSASAARQIGEILRGQPQLAALLDAARAYRAAGGVVDDGVALDPGTAVEQASSGIVELDLDRDDRAPASAGASAGSCGDLLTHRPGIVRPAILNKGKYHG